MTNHGKVIMKILKIFLLLLLAVIICSASAAPQKNTVPPMQKKLQLPEIVYALPGIECNIYFENIFLAINPANFAFQVQCAKGRCDEKRWYFTPKASDVGNYELKILVHDDDGVVAERATKLVVIPADAGKNKNISILIIGSSNISMGHAFPSHIYNLCKVPGNPKLKMIGENGPGFPDKLKEIRHEGYGGWSYSTFTTKGRKRIKGRSNARENPFWNFKTNALDFTSYFKKNNQGKAPDFVIISLGGNDTFSCTDANIDIKLKAIRQRINLFISALRKAAPNAFIGLNQIEYCSKSQDAFGNNYGTRQTRWQTRKNLFKYRQMLEEFVKNSGDKKLFVVPIYISIDNENNVRKHLVRANARTKVRVLRDSNGLHPMPSGYQQCADCAFSWMKYLLNKNK